MSSRSPSGFPRTFSQEREPSFIEYLMIVLGLSADLAAALLKELNQALVYASDFILALLFGFPSDPYAPSAEEHEALEIP